MENYVASKKSKDFWGMDGKLKSFEKFAHTYGEYNVIQKKIIKKYFPLLKNRIVDLGCGSEGLCKYKEFDFYLGIDNSAEMLKRNPCNTLKADFNDKECFETIKKYDFEQIVSFSALQWARDLREVFFNIKGLKKEYIISLFTSNTFSSLHKELSITSPIYSYSEIMECAGVLNPDKIETLRFKMEFSSPKEMLNYIRYSAVSGNVHVSPAKLRNFLKTFRVRFLEFETVVLIGGTL